MTESKGASGKPATPITTGFIQYVLVGGLVLYAWYAYDELGVIAPAVLLLPAAVLLLPAGQRRIGVFFGRGTSIVVAVSFLFGIAGWAGWIKHDREEKALAQQEKDSAARVAARKKERETEYATNKAKIISEVEEQLANNRPREAAATIAKFMTVTKDPDLGRLQHRANVQVMRLDLQNEANLSLERRQQIYATLAKEELASKSIFEAKLKGVEADLETRRIQQQREAKRQALHQAVKSQFSSFDGSHRGVEAAIKASLKDPSSYQHVNTRYSVGSDALTVYTTYRARNSFNARVTETRTATVDANGNVMFMQ